MIFYLSNIIKSIMTHQDYNTSSSSLDQLIEPSIAAVDHESTNIGNVLVVHNEDNEFTTNLTVSSSIDYELPTSTDTTSMTSNNDLTHSDPDTLLDSNNLQVIEATQDTFESDLLHHDMDQDCSNESEHENNMDPDDFFEQQKRKTKAIISSFLNGGLTAKSILKDTEFDSSSTQVVPKPNRKKLKKLKLDDDEYNPKLELRRSARETCSTSNQEYSDSDSDMEYGRKRKSNYSKKSYTASNVHDMDRSERMKTIQTQSDVSHFRLPYVVFRDEFPPEKRVFGQIEGVPVGSLFHFRQDAHLARIHRGFVQGIYGHAKYGCWSICVNGGYPEDVDEGDRIVFTGSGGRDLKTKNLRTGAQTSDQTVNNTSNASLITSHKLGLPIRVLRGPKSHAPNAARNCYRYDGLYTCKEWNFEQGQAGYKVIRFTLERMPGQTPLEDLPVGFDDLRWTAIHESVLAYRNMTQEEFDQQAREFTLQTGKHKPAQPASVKKQGSTGSSLSESPSKPDSELQMNENASPCVSNGSFTAHAEPCEPVQRPKRQCVKPQVNHLLGSDHDEDELADQSFNQQCPVDLDSDMHMLSENNSGDMDGRTHSRVGPKPLVVRKTRKALSNRVPEPPSNLTIPTGTKDNIEPLPTKRKVKPMPKSKKDKLLRTRLL